MKPFLKLVSLFSKKEKQRLIILIIILLFTSLLEIVEVGSIAPFMAVASDPEIINRQPALAFLYKLGGFDKQDGNTGFLIFLGISLFFLIVAITALNSVISYIVFRFTANRRYVLSVRLFRQYLFQPYHFFLNKNSGELSKNLLYEADTVINLIMRPSMDIITYGSRTIAVFVFLVVLNPLIAALSAAVFGILYFGLYGIVRNKLKYFGTLVRDSNALRYKTTAEAFGGIKDIKILGKESSFTNAYSLGAKQFAATQAAQQIFITLPSKIMQSMAIGFAVALVVILLITKGSLTEAIPLLSVYAFAVMRLMPNLQHIFSSASQIRYSAPTIDALHKDLSELMPPPAEVFPVKKGHAAAEEIMPFTRDIELKQIVFSYPASLEPALKGINITIKKNTVIAFAGTTGCGKTTLADVIMGLLEPGTGSVNVDGTPVIFPSGGKDNRALIWPWQRNFGYVPQQIYLSDDTVAANIAFGIPEKLRDAAAVEKAARISNLHDFIVNELPDGYNTFVGEKGIRLSGGQRQRIGIARALYHDPGILVMDEATSALDSITEDAVMDAIHGLMHKKTVIIIAHRLTTIQECETIYLMKQGTITASGTYKELIQNSEQFRAMAKAGE